MRQLRNLSRLLLIGVALIFVTAPAVGAQGSGEQPPLVIGDGTVTATVNVNPDETVTFQLRDDDGGQAAGVIGGSLVGGATYRVASFPVAVLETKTSVADSNGVASATFDTSDLDSGLYRIVATVTRSGSVVTVLDRAFVINNDQAATTTTTAATGGTLAETGASNNSLPLARAGAVVVLAGGLVLYAARRRERSKLN